jgi:hypothetical protein
VRLPERPDLALGIIKLIASPEHRQRREKTFATRRRIAIELAERLNSTQINSQRRSQSQSGRQRGANSARLTAQLNQVVDRQVQGIGDFLEQAVASFASSGLDLAHKRCADAGFRRQLFTGHAAIFPPDADGAFARDNALGEGRRNQFLFARS